MQSVKRRAYGIIIMAKMDKHSVAVNFGRAARNYEKHAVLQKMVGERLLERLDLVRISPERIVDIGAGTGTTARALADRYKTAKIIQVDLTPGMLQQSRSRSSRLFSRQRYICADAENLPLASGKSDLVFSSLTYQWCNDLDRAFSEAGRILLPGGLFLFATLGPDTLKELRTSWSEVDDAVHVNTFFDMHDIGDALVRTGMTSVVMDTENIVMTYPDCYALMHDLKKIGALNADTTRQKGLTGKNKIRLLVNAYEKFRKNNELPATYEIVYGHAWMPERKKQPGPQVAYVPVDNIRKQKNL